jgi:hypothetical protein
MLSFMDDPLCQFHQHFCTVFLAQEFLVHLFMYLKFSLTLFALKIGGKAGLKMLVKLTTFLSLKISQSKNDHVQNVLIFLSV